MEAIVILVLLSKCNFIQNPMTARLTRPLIKGCPEGVVVGLGLRLRERDFVVVDDRDEVVEDIGV